MDPVPWNIDAALLPERGVASSSTRCNRFSGDYRASVIRPVDMILAEQDDEWQDGGSYFRLETMALIDTMTEQEDAPELPMAS